MENNVPDFQSIMLPFLQLLSNGQIYSMSEVMEKLAKHFKLSKNDLRIKIPSGSAGLFHNRVGWTRSYLKYAGLIEYPSRGNYKITKDGLKVVGQQPDFINIAYLKQFPKFKEWQGSYGRTKSQGEPLKIKEGSSKTPDESLGESLIEIHQQVVIELLDTLTKKKPEYFERFVLILLDKMGYGGVEEENFEVVGKSNDGGIDGIIYQDQLGLDRIYVQAKKWKKDDSVGPTHIRDFIGSLNLKGSNKGVFITTSRFTKEARATAVKNPHNRVVLIDGNELAELAIKYNVGVQIRKVFELKGIDQDFFDEDSTI